MPPRNLGRDGGPEAAAIGRMRLLREQCGRSTSELADRMQTAGVLWSTPLVWNLENGRRKVLFVDEALALAEVFDVPFSTLIYGGEVTRTIRL